MSADTKGHIKTGERVVCVAGSKIDAQGTVVHASDAHLVVACDDGREVSSGRDRLEREKVSTMHQTSDRKAGAVVAAFALSWGTHDEAMRADAKVIADDALFIIQRRMVACGVLVHTPDHIAGAAQFFRELADALDEHAAKMRR